MMRARVGPGAGANCWRRFFAIESSGSSGGGGGSVDLNNDRRRALTLSLWRDYLCLLERLEPEDAARRRASTAAAIRSWSDPEPENGAPRARGEEEGSDADADGGVKRLMAAVSFLRATTRRSATDRKRLSRGSGEGVFVVREGELVRVEGGEEGSLAASRSTQAGKLTPDEAFRKHRDLMRRQFYGREPPRGATGAF